MTVEFRTVVYNVFRGDEYMTTVLSEEEAIAMTCGWGDRDYEIEEIVELYPGEEKSRI